MQITITNEDLIESRKICDYYNNRMYNPESEKDLEPQIGKHKTYCNLCIVAYSLERQIGVAFVVTGAVILQRENISGGKILFETNMPHEVSNLVYHFDNKNDSRAKQMLPLTFEFPWPN